MSRIIALILLAACAAAPHFVLAVTIPTVPVGNAGNAADPSTGNRYGSVSYDYRIGTTEVTNAQYAAFLNAVAITDTYLLYNPSMSLNPWGGITKIGSLFTVKSDVPGAGPGGSDYTYANKPVNFVSWGDAVRFANWLHNGQPGLGIPGGVPQDANSTEDGAYTLNGAMSASDLNSVVRNAGALWFLTSEDEWYKAAYHKNDGATTNYFDYPTASDTAPTAEAPAGGSNSANYDFGVGDLTDVGAYSASASPYGTFDQGGNVWEWNEASIALISGSFRGLRGGSVIDNAGFLQPSAQGRNNPTFERDNYGFRVATIPEPSSIALAAVALVGLAALCLRRQA